MQNTPNVWMSLKIIDKLLKQVTNSTYCAPTGSKRGTVHWDTALGGVCLQIWLLATAHSQINHLDQLWRKENRRSIHFPMQEGKQLGVHTFVYSLSPIETGIFLLKRAYGIKSGRKPTSNLIAIQIETDSLIGHIIQFVPNKQTNKTSASFSSSFTWQAQRSQLCEQKKYAIIFLLASLCPTDIRASK